MTFGMKNIIIPRELKPDENGIVFNELTDESVDMILTDPPYGEKCRSNRRIANEKLLEFETCDILGWLDTLFKDMHRVLKNNSAIYVFTRQSTFPQFKEAMSKYFTIKNAIVWVKNNHGAGDLKCQYGPKYEMIIYGMKGKRAFERTRQSDVWYCPRINSPDLLHAAQKPLVLLQNAIENSSKVGDLILDPFMGCASTAVASINTGRDYFGYEMLNDVYNDGINRIVNHVVGTIDDKIHAHKMKVSGVMTDEIGGE